MTMVRFTSRDSGTWQQDGSWLSIWMGSFVGRKSLRVFSWQIWQDGFFLPGTKPEEVGNRRPKYAKAL